MTEIYLIRHAQAEGNLYRMMQGFWDGNITVLGKKQIDALADRLAGTPLDAVYASDLYRARLTARAAAKGRGLTVQLDPRLREIDMGPWEARFFGNLCHEEPEAAALFTHSPQFWQVDGSENYAQVSRRAFPALLEIAQKHEGQRVAVISHGVTIRCLLSTALQIPLERLEELPICKNTSISHLIYENGAFRAESINDYRHLETVGGTQWSKTADLRHEAIDPAREREYYCACYADAWQAAHGSLSGFCADVYLDSALEHYRQDPGSILKFYRGDEPVGLVDLDTRRGAHMDCGWLSLIYLTEEYRNQGYGIQLLGRALMKYRDMGRRTLRLHVAEENAPALSFYRKHGFRLLSGEDRGSGKLLLLEKPLWEVRDELD